MAERYDLKTARVDKNGKTWWTKIGVMFPMKGDKDGFNLSFEALPIPTLNQEGNLEVRVVAWEPYREDKDKVNGTSRSNPGDVMSQPTGAPATEADLEKMNDDGEKLDDEIPF